MVKRWPAMYGWLARCASSIENSASLSRTDASMSALWRSDGGVRTHWMKASRLVRLSVVCCQSIQRSASKRAGSSLG